MTSFYEKAMKNEVLGPFFIDEIGDDIQSEDWIEHIELLEDFWLAKLLNKDTYYGNFVGAHVKLPHIKIESFSIWLDLFGQTADEVYVPKVADQFKKKGIAFSKQFLNRTKNI